jgi:glycogen operon protein
LHAFFRKLTDLRKTHATLRCDRFMGDAEVSDGIKELSWWDERGVELTQEDWDNQSGRVLILRRAGRSENGRLEITALMLNADSNRLEFKLPGPFPWRVLLDSGEPMLDPHAIDGQTYPIEGRGAVILVAEVDIPA